MLERWGSYAEEPGEGASRVSDWCLARAIVSPTFEGVRNWEFGPGTARVLGESWSCAKFLAGEISNSLGTFTAFPENVEGFRSPKWACQGSRLGGDRPGTPG